LVGLGVIVTTADALDKASDKVFAALDELGGDLRALPVPQQTVAVIYAAQGVIDNGGFKYFFEADWPNNPPYSMFIDAYRRIGAVGAAECFERAIAMFPLPDPHMNRELRNLFMDDLPEKHEFFELGFKVCGDQAIWDKLADYVVANNL
jgi:hypothetical protein